MALFNFRAMSWFSVRAGETGEKATVRWGAGFMDFEKD